MFRDYAIANRKAEARATANLFGGKKRLKYLGHIILRDSRPGVLDIDHHAVSASKYAEGELSAVRHRVNRVCRECDHSLLDLAAIGADQRKIRFDLDLLQNAGPAFLV